MDSHIGVSTLTEDLVVNDPTVAQLMVNPLVCTAKRSEEHANNPDSLYNQCNELMFVYLLDHDGLC